MKTMTFLALATLGAGAAVWTALGLIGHARVQGAPTSSDALKSLATEGWRSDRFRVDSEAELVGLVRPPREPKRPWVLGFAGNSANMTREMRAFLERMGRDRDWGFATWAYRGFDASSGVTRGTNVAADAQAMFEHLVRDHRVAPERVHIVGFSLGSAFAAHLGARLRARGVPLGSIALLSPGLTGPRVPRLLAPWVRGPFQLRPLIEQLPAPLLVVAAVHDRVHPVDFNARVIRDRAGPGLEYLEIEGDHGATITEQPALDALCRHIERAASHEQG